MTTHPFNLEVVHPSWRACLKQALQRLDPSYLEKLTLSPGWLPGPQQIFNSFSLPLTEVKYVLFGESPYPRKESAKGYAFWDASVKEIWSPTGLSKKVNRATSLRNILKMLLVAENVLDKKRTGQEAIAALDKADFVETSDALFKNFLAHGFLLLNATLVFEPGSRQKHTRAWYPFIEEMLNCLIEKNPQVHFILLGRLASPIENLISHLPIKTLYAEHPYNHSFIANPTVIDFFKPLHLLRKNSFSRKN